MEETGFSLYFTTGDHLSEIRALSAILLAVFLTAVPVYAASPPHTNYRPGYGSTCSVGAACHSFFKNKFLKASAETNPATDYTEFCLTCHNPAGEAHAKSAGSPSTNAYLNLTAFKSYSSFRGSSHSWNGVNGKAGARTPTLSGFEAAKYM